MESKNSTLSVSYRNVGIQSSGTAANILAVTISLLAIAYVVNTLQK